MCIRLSATSLCMYYINVSLTPTWWGFCNSSNMTRLQTLASFCRCNSKSLAHDHTASPVQSQDLDPGRWHLLDSWEWAPPYPLFHDPCSLHPRPCLPRQWNSRAYRLHLCVILDSNHFEWLLWYKIIIKLWYQIIMKTNIYPALIMSQPCI